MKIWTLTLSIIFSSLAWAQEETIAKKMEEAFVAFEKYGSIELQLATPIYSFYVGAPDINGLAYVPNFNPQLRLALAYKDFRFVTNVHSVKLPPEEDERRGISDQVNILFEKYGRNWAIDFYSQYYKGFYLANPIGEFDLHKPSRYPQLPDAEIINYGINYYWVLDASRYSLAAGYKQRELQKISGGSFVLNGFFNHVEMKRGTKLKPGSDPGAITVLPEIKNSRLSTLGATWGYGYTYVDGSFFFSNQALIGGGGQRQTILSTTEGKDTDRYNLALKLNLNSALGKNFADHSYGMRFLLDSLLSNVDDVQLYSTQAGLQFFYIHRF